MTFPLPDRIQWHEGLLLSPQHFQQSQARIDATVSWHMLAAAPFAWGVRHIEVDSGLLSGGVLRISALEAVMPDGTAVWHDASRADQASLQIDLGPYVTLLESAPMDVWLTLPRARSMREPGAPSRFKSVSGALVEDEVSEAVMADLPRLRLNLDLIVGTAPTSLWDGLRLGCIVKENEQMRLGDDPPPLMMLQRTHPLWRRAWDLATQLRLKAAFVARQTQAPSSRTEDRIATLEHRDRLRSLLSGLAPLEAVLQTVPLHPFTLYLALCELLGPLALLRTGALPVLPPPYDHARPGLSFGVLLVALEEALSEVSQDHRLLPFEYNHAVFSLVLQESWMTSRLVVGLRGQPEKDLIAWMAGAVIGSKSSWASLRERRVLGASRYRVESAPEIGVRAGNGYTLFALDATVPLVSPGEPLMISNANETSAAQRPQEMVLFVKEL